MFSRYRRSSALAVCAVAIVAAGITTGVVVAARLDAPENPIRIRDALESAPLQSVVDVPDAAGAAKRSVFVQRAGGMLCLWDATSASGKVRQGGCNLESDPLGHSELFVSYAFDGGPAVSDITDARLIGLASSRVAEIEIALSDGSVRKPALRPAHAAGPEFQAFAYRVARHDLRRGVGPVAVRAFDENGTQIANETGFAG